MLSSSSSASAHIQANQIIISFVVDEDPVFAYTGLHLLNSLVLHLGLAPDQIHVQFTPEVPAQTVHAFRGRGSKVHRLQRFGDGRYCNKLAQWDNLRDVAADHLIFLDTDMICVGDFLKYLPANAVAGKIVDLDNPKLPLLDLLFDRAGFADRPRVIDADARGYTYDANCNGGLYSMPRNAAEELFNAWRRRALELLADIEPLRAVKKESHVDQIAFCMAIHETGLPFASLPSNANYPLHLPHPKSMRLPEPLALLHYHNPSLNVVGLIDLAFEGDAGEKEAVALANRQIRDQFDTQTFWDFRYRHFPDRGSGVGSRGGNLDYKRQLLRNAEVEAASSVLDVGCGDLEVVHALSISNYVGLDSSEASLSVARDRRPDWTFLQAPAPQVAAAEVVLCFEVAIHQKTEEEYRELIAFLSSKTTKTLLISGYDALTEKISQNHMLSFFEPLAETLENTGAFSSIEKIGAHSDVAIYRCSV